MSRKVKQSKDTYNCGSVKCKWCESNRVKTIQQLEKLIEVEESQKFRVIPIEYLPMGDCMLAVRPELPLNPSISDVLAMGIPVGWDEIFQPYTGIIEMIESRLRLESGKILPDPIDIFRAFELCNPEDVKVVIVGQDPYYTMGNDNKPTATGLSFSVRKGQPIPKSLKNIFAELKRDIEGFAKPSHGNLEYWAEQGVLMLNRALTVAKGNPDSHTNIWEELTSSVVCNLSSKYPEIVYMLWGRSAQKMVGSITNGEMLEAGHPVGRNNKYKFQGCKHFSKANELLEEWGREPIDWVIRD